MLAMKVRTGISMIAIMVAPTMAIAQADVYKAKCQNCHGATGVPSPSVAKYVGVRPVTDPAVKDMSKEKMIDVTTNGSGKMPAFKGKLTDAQIKAVVSYYRTLVK